MIVDEGLELLTDEECRRLLAMCEVGRVGITIGALPAIFPVNYRLIDGAIVFRTSPGSKLSAAAAGAVVAFEVDDYQAADRSGWSVLAIGRAEIVLDLDLTFRVLAARLEPFVEGLRSSIVRIEPTFLSGRRLVHTPQSAGRGRRRRSALAPMKQLESDGRPSRRLGGGRRRRGAAQ